MSLVLRWSTISLDDLDKLRPELAIRIAKKVAWFAEQADPFYFAEPVEGRFEGQFRFRVGDYRIFFERDKGKLRVLLVLRVKHRGEAYRK